MSKSSDRIPPQTQAGSPSLPPTLLCEWLCADLVERWRRGERVPTEAYLQRYPGLGDEHSFELILTEIVLRQEYAEPAPPEEFLWRFPQFADRLSRHFALHATLAETPVDLATTTDLDGQPAPSLPAPATLPPVFGYEVLEELGRGGMGVIYRARDPRLGRDVALKFLPAEFAGDSDRLERLLREARTASALNHPNICTVHALGEHEGRPFIVMEMVEGDTLHTLLERGLDIDEAARLIAQAARALAAAHATGVVHRDIKPENLMVRPDGYVKVLDFGLARRLPQIFQSEGSRGSATAPGAILGTVAYMSPEQARGEAAESSSDIFSLGVVLYQLVTGRRPFEAGSSLETLAAILKCQPLPPSRLEPATPAFLDGLLQRMLHKDPLLRPTAAEIEAALSGLASVPPLRVMLPSATTSRPLIRREPELALLQAALDDADAGRGSLVCVAGEPGIGKTTLVEDFLAGLAAAGRTCLVACGQCSERLSDTEAYLPVVDALKDLLSADASGTIARALHVVAPAWHAQVAPGTSATAESADLSERASSQQAMLREFCSLIQEASRLGTLVLFLDDVHWADASTVDLLAQLGRQCRSLRTLVIVTFRPTEMLLGPHPFHHVKRELQGQGVCIELTLGFLSRRDVGAYLSLAFPGHAFGADFADLIYLRTEGSPLFMVDLLRYLRERGVIAEVDGSWTLARALPDLRRDLPGSVRGMIERKLERLDDHDRRLLSAASVQGHEFDSAVLAGALNEDASEVEERLEALDRVHGLVRQLRELEFPDRTLSVRYAFVHILYQQALYTSLQPTRRASLGAALAQALERRHAGQSTAAAELAWLYEVGRDIPRAAYQLWRASHNAASVFAHREAASLAERGLQLLQAVPEGPERASLEISLQTTLGMQLQVTEGFAALKARQAYSRARELCLRHPDPAPLFPVLWGLWLYSKVRSELGKAQEMAEELLALAVRLRDPDLALQAHQALGMTAFCRGEPARVIPHVDQTAALYDPDRHRSHAYLFGQDPSVICNAFGAIALWLLGYPEQARRQSDDTIRRSRRLSPSSQAVALHFAAKLHHLRRDPQRALTCSEASCTVSSEQGFAFWFAGGNILSGWALAACGNAEEGLARLRQGLLEWRKINSLTYQTYYLGLLAETLRSMGRDDEAQDALDEALELASKTGEGFYEAELRRLKGDCLLSTDEGDAELCYRQALDIARRQEARSFELRAATSLAGLYQRQGRPADAWPFVPTIFSWFTEGFDTHDMLQARRFLATSSVDSQP